MKEIYPIIQKLIETLEERKELAYSDLVKAIYIIIINIVKHIFKDITKDDIVIIKSEYIRLLYLEKYHLENNYYKGDKVVIIKQIIKEIEEINEKIEYLKLE